MVNGKGFGGKKKKRLTLFHKLDCQTGTIRAHKGKHAYNHNEHSRAEHWRSHYQQLLDVGQQVLWRNLLQKVLWKNKHMHEVARNDRGADTQMIPELSKSIRRQKNKVWTTNLFVLKVIHQSGKTETSAFYRFFILEKTKTKRGSCLRSTAARNQDATILANLIRT